MGGELQCDLIGNRFRDPPLHCVVLQIQSEELLIEHVHPIR